MIRTWENGVWCRVTESSVKWDVSLEYTRHRIRHVFLQNPQPRPERDPTIIVDLVDQSHLSGVWTRDLKSLDKTWSLVYFPWFWIRTEGTKVRVHESMITKKTHFISKVHRLSIYSRIMFLTQNKTLQTNDAWPKYCLWRKYRDNQPLLLIG